MSEAMRSGVYREVISNLDQQRHGRIRTPFSRGRSSHMMRSDVQVGRAIGRFLYLDDLRRALQMRQSRPSAMGLTHARRVRRPEVSRTSELREEIELLKEDIQQTDQRVDKLAPLADEGHRLPRLSGSSSSAAMAPASARDTGFSELPRVLGTSSPTRGRSWEIRCPRSVNSRGEPATTGESRADHVSIRSSSKGPTLHRQLAQCRTVRAGRVEHAPDRRSSMSSRAAATSSVKDLDSIFLGDFIDVRLAYVEQRIQKKLDRPRAVRRQVRLCDRASSTARRRRPRASRSRRL